jgi:hypothetical protein
VTQTASVWLVLVLAFCAANLPFLSQRVLGVVALAGGKNLAIRLGELVLLYFVAGRLRRKAGSSTPSPARCSSRSPSRASCGATCSSTESKPWPTTAT